MQASEPDERQGIRKIIERRDSLVRGIAIIADQDHVATGIERQSSPFRHRTVGLGSLHAEVVAEYGAAKADPRAQLPLDPVAGKPGRQRVELFVDDVRQHDADDRTSACEALVRTHVVEDQAVLAAVDGQLQV